MQTFLPKVKCLINETTFIYGGAVMKNRMKSTKEGTFVLIKNELFPEIVICFTNILMISELGSGY